MGGECRELCVLLYKLIRTLFSLVVKVTVYEDRITSNAYHAGGVIGGVSCNLKPNVRKPSLVREKILYTVLDL